MGIGVSTLWVTQISKDDNSTQYISDYKPVKKNDGWCYPEGASMLGEMDIPSIISNLSFDDDPVPVEIVPSDVETGLYIYCQDGYFGDEVYLSNAKLEKNDKGKFDHPSKLPDEIYNKLGYEPWEIHVREDGERHSWLRFLRDGKDTRMINVTLKEWKEK